MFQIDLNSTKYCIEFIDYFKYICIGRFIAMCEKELVNFANILNYMNLIEELVIIYYISIRVSTNYNNAFTTMFVCINSWLLILTNNSISLK